MADSTAASYRRATGLDARALAVLRWEFRVEEGGAGDKAGREAFVEACAAILAPAIEDGTWAVFVAEVEGEIVAHVFVQAFAKVPKPGRLHDRMGYMTNFYTKPAHRNAGIGRELLRRASTWAAEADLEMLVVWPSDRARPLYARSGFVPEAEAMSLELRPYVD